MWLTLLLLLTGIFLIFFEFFVPGGFLALLGGFVVVASVTLFSFSETAIIYKILFLVLSAFLILLTCRIALWVIKKRKGDTICLRRDQEGYTASSFENELIGLEGKALTDLKPSGYVLIGSKRCQAVSVGPYIKKGAPIFVEGGQGAHLLIKEI